MSSDLRAPGWLVKHLAVAVFLVVAGVLVLGALGYELQTHAPMVQWDTQLAARLHSMAVKTPGMILEFLTYGFFMGKEDLQVLGAILIIYFLHKRLWPELGMVLIGWVGGSVVWTFLVNYFNRPRPQEQVGIEVRSIPSFPSGHTMFATMALGLLAYLLIPKMPSLFWKWVIALAAILAILFIGFSRVYEGGHYLSDVIAGYATALAWGTLVYTLMEAIGRRGRT
ncbi:MAG: phosphatase PAP2 family protein [Bacteroidota bacterium]